MSGGILDARERVLDRRRVGRRERPLGLLERLERGRVLIAAQERAGALELVRVELLAEIGAELAAVGPVSVGGLDGGDLGGALALEGAVDGFLVGAEAVHRLEELVRRRAHRRRIDWALAGGLVGGPVLADRRRHTCRLRSDRHVRPTGELGGRGGRGRRLVVPSSAPGNVE